MEELLSQLLEEYLQRRAEGEIPNPEDYRERAGAHYAEFVELLVAESAIDAAMGLEVATPLPANFGRHTLLRELGRGAVGVVYEALHRDLGRTVALKVLRAGFDTTPQAIERFRREAVACARVRHDHIVEVYESGDVDGRPFYAMALLEGKSLGELAKQGGLPPPREFCGRLAGVADALHALHEKGIIHRDVKPSNIMVEPSGRMVLADFGLARTLTSASLTKSGEALGTPLYMSPEQLLGRRTEINARSDVYGLGATMYGALAGRPIFQSDDIQTMAHQILRERPKSLREVAPHVPIDCERIVMKAVEKRNEDRYESAAAMRDDLLAFAEGKGVAGRPVSAMRHRLRRLQRRWKPLAAAAVALVAVGLWYFNRPATLRVDCYPAAEVLLDGELVGTTPQRLAVAPGDHDLMLRSGGFLERKSAVHLAAGEQRSVELVLIAENPQDPLAIAKLAHKFQVAVAELDETRKRGSSEETGVFPLLPRGAVRLGRDLEHYRIDVGPAFERTGTLQFRASGHTLLSQPFDPVNLSTVAAFPPEVRDALEVGQEVTWGFYPDDGDPVTATFRVVSDVEPQQIERRLEGQDPVLLANLRALFYLKHGLFSAAFREGEACPQSAHACAVIQQALRGLGLEESPLWDELNVRIDRLPPEVKESAK